MDSMPSLSRPTTNVKGRRGRMSVPIRNVRYLAPIEMSSFRCLWARVIGSSFSTGVSTRDGAISSGYPPSRRREDRAPKECDPSGRRSAVGRRGGVRPRDPASALPSPRHRPPKCQTPGVLGQSPHELPHAATPGSSTRASRSGGRHFEQKPPYLTHAQLQQPSGVRVRSFDDTPRNAASLSRSR